MKGEMSSEGGHASQISAPPDKFILFRLRVMPLTAKPWKNSPAIGKKERKPHVTQKNVPPLKKDHTKNHPDPGLSVDDANAANGRSGRRIRHE